MKTFLAASALFVGALAATPSEAQPFRIGPSFDCRKATTAIQQYMCADASLSKIEIEYARVYYAVRHQVGPSGWQALKSEALAFYDTSIAVCGLDNLSDRILKTSLKTTCLGGTFIQQAEALTRRLSGPALDEVRRPIVDHIALQMDLQERGYLPPTETIDGVYGLATRVAIEAWQATNNLPVTGFIANAEVPKLKNGVVAQKPVTLPVAPVVAAKSVTPAAPVIAMKPIVAENTPTPYRVPPNPSYTYDLPKVAPRVFGAWQRMVPPQLTSEKWLYTFSPSVGSPIRDVTVDGRPMKFGTVCKPHDCGDNIAGILFSPEQDRVGGLLRIEGGGYQTLGSLTPTEYACVDLFMDRHQSTGCVSGNAGANSPVAGAAPTRLPGPVSSPDAIYMKQ